MIGASNRRAYALIRRRYDHRCSFPDTRRSHPSATPSVGIPLPDEPPIQRRHELRIGDTALAYYSTTGMLPLKNAAGETEAQIFFIAYTSNTPEGDSRRPLMIMFNGGPGAASILSAYGRI